MRTAIFALATLVLAGCAAPSQSAGEAPAALTVAATLEPPSIPKGGTPAGTGGLVHVDVPVDVFMVGFTAAEAGALQTKLAPLTVKHQVVDRPRVVLAPDEPARQYGANPIQPTAIYNIHRLAVEEELEAALAAAPAENGQYDAWLAEDLLLEMIANQGHTLRENTPAMVLLRLSEVGHSYRMQYPTGHVDGVRVFGERTPLLVLDVSAAVDPWVGNPSVYNSPLTGPDITQHLVDAVRTATEFRLLQGPLFPPSLKMCHGVTLLTVIRAGALAETLPGYTRAQDLVSAENLTRSFEALLGEGRVHVDPVFIELPQDDPGLDVVLRGRALDTIRIWMDENWENYWVSHEGCEAYVSIFVVGDAGDPGVSGTAFYDIREGRRLSFSSFNDQNRMEEEGSGMGAPVFHVPDDTRYRTDWINFLYSHETGHLFGQRHPHDISHEQGGSSDRTFSSIWSSMSYQQDGKLPQFGAIDVNNQLRNRAGFLLDALVIAEGSDHVAVVEALQVLGNHQWREANDVLEAGLYGAP